MEICREHDKDIIHDEYSCPVCKLEEELKNEIRSLTDENESLDQENTELKEKIENLEEQLDDLS